MRYITRTVLLLSFVSLFADISSEMLYPIMPGFLSDIGMTALGIGLLEGFVAFLAGFGKVWFGSLSDMLDRRMVFVRGGYLLSTLAKPLMGLFPSVGPVVAARGVDRMGKGLRSASRDAVLYVESRPEDRGKVFGFHRTMDSIGAVIGPIIALIYLQAYPGDYITLFLLAFLPGILGVLLTLLIREPKPEPRKVELWASLKRPWAFWREASPTYKRMIGGFMLFALLNSSDFFLLLRADEAGMAFPDLLGAYLVYNIVYALSSWPLGGLGDRIGFRPVYLFSVLVFATCYFALGMVNDAFWLYVIFGLYGLFTAAHAGIAKSWLTLHIPPDQKATGIGLYEFLHTAFHLLASPLIGLIWVITTGETAFILIGALAFFTFLLLLFLLPSQPAAGTHRNN